MKDGISIIASPAGDLYGAARVRIRLNGGTTVLEGICGEFIIQLGKVTPQFGLADLFFYGNETEFTANFLGQDRAKHLLTDLFPQHIEVTDREHNYARIPISELGLTHNQNSLAEQVFAYIEKDLERPLERKDFPLTKRSHAHLRTKMLRFPKDFYDWAKEAGYYLSRDELINHSLFEEKGEGPIQRASTSFGHRRNPGKARVHY